MILNRENMRNKKVILILLAIGTVIFNKVEKGFMDTV
jgi:hypothetical protein